MKLYGHPLSTCTRKVLMTAAEKAAPIDLVAIDLFAGAHKAPEHVARHPFGVIPVLDDDGFVLYESRAIVRYLDARLAGASLVPAAPRPRARMDQWISVDQAYVAPHLRTLIGQRIVGKHQGLAPDVVATDEAERALVHAFAAIDRALHADRYLAGETFSLADISLMPYIAALTAVEASHTIGDLRHLQRWWNEVSARPAWLRATA
ncbi:MAG: glutathione S-transferase N-terminal domain-containing protein [Kofleriaceae bacterium]